MKLSCNEEDTMQVSRAKGGMKTVKSLNVGCGATEWGDVRLDIAHTFLGQKSKLNILADAHHLPFKPKCFDVVLCFHVIEHLANPFKALDEMDRIANGQILLTFPSERDVVPIFLVSMLPFPNLRYIYDSTYTRRKDLHLWIINPAVIADFLTNKGWKCSVEKGESCIFSFFEGGRKAKYFKWLTRHFRIQTEWKIKACARVY